MGGRSHWLRASSAPSPRCWDRGWHQGLRPRHRVHTRRAKRPWVDCAEGVSCRGRARATHLQTNSHMRVRGRLAGRASMVSVGSV